MTNSAASVLVNNEMIFSFFRKLALVTSIHQHSNLLIQNLSQPCRHIINHSDCFASNNLLDKILQIDKIFSDNSVQNARCHNVLQFYILFIQIKFGE